MNPHVAAEIAALPDKTVSQLVKRYEELTGDECRSRHKGYLARRIAWRLQADAEGGLSERAVKRAEELAVGAEFRVTKPREDIVAEYKMVAAEPNGFVDWDPRLPPPGSWIERKYKGQMLRVLVLNEGFEYEGRRYRTLTAIAKEVSGQHVGGFRFFQLGFQK